MKNAKLRVRVACVDRDFYLSQRRSKGKLISRNYFVKFWPPLWVRKAKGLGRVCLSTGYSEIEPARRQAQKIIESFWKDGGESAAAAGLLGRADVEQSFAMLNEILERYRPLPQLVKPEVATANRAALRLFVREGAGMDTERATAAVFKDGEIVEKFLRQRQERAANMDFVKQHRADRTANSTLRRARSVFAKEHLHLYKGLRLPDLTGFMTARAIKVKWDGSFVPFPPGWIERIEAELPMQSRNVQVTGLLMRYLGLRNSEVEHAKWEWFSRFADGTGEISIEDRAYHKIKNESIRTIEMDRELVAKLAPFWGAADEWVIGPSRTGTSPTATDRYDVTHYDINDWLRAIIVGRTKVSYELRKHAGSEVLTRDGLEAAARFLGDTITTSEKVYARYLKKVRSAGRLEVARAAA